MSTLSDNQGLELDQLSFAVVLEMNNDAVPSATPNEVIARLDNPEMKTSLIGSGLVARPGSLDARRSSAHDCRDHG